MFVDRLNEMWKKTLGQNVHLLKNLGILPEEIASVFKSAVEARNELAHESAVDFPGIREKDIEQYISHLRNLVGSIAEANKYVAMLLHLINKAPLPTKHSLERYENRVKSWVSEQTVES